MSYTTLFFDLDDTLYPSGSGLWNAIRDRMNRYLLERLKFPESDAVALRKHYFETYGTTLRGLQVHHQVDADEYLAYVHDLPLSQYLKPDPALHELLLSLPQPKWIFTNADAPHAGRVLSELGLADCFSGIVDIRATHFACKPEVTAYERAIEAAGESAPRHCALFDDSPRNLAPARQMGFFTVLVGSTRPDTAACRSVHSLLDLPQAAPELWSGNQRSGFE